MGYRQWRLTLPDLVPDFRAPSCFSTATRQPSYAQIPGLCIQSLTWRLPVGGMNKCTHETMTRVTPTNLARARPDSFVNRHVIRR